MSKTRSNQQQTGSHGERIVALLAENSGCWLARHQQEDFGIDLEFELTHPAVVGEILKVQVKSSETIGRRTGEIEAILPKSLIHLGENLRVPLVLVIVEISTHRAWYLWIQRWWLHARQKGARLDQLPESSTVWVPEEHELVAGLQSELKDIARGQTPEQLVISLSGAVKAAVQQRSSVLLAPLIQLLASVGPLPDPFPIGLVIDRVLEMGGKIWGTPEGNRETGMLFTICGAFGDRFTAEQIDQLVWRGENYSRTGINALDALYTSFPRHVVGLDLSRRYANYGELRPAFYCALREAHPTISYLSLLAAAHGFRAHGIRLIDVDESTLFDKLASRGPSAILDYVEAVKESP
ncbi:MAG TPA: DUF4365 domain-containing protein [Chthoniobacterales bacterium]|nr:DUF4365 domain-containing protein [Chthoniobacterales bacterium]